MPKLNRADAAFEIPDELPVIALRDLVFFPYVVLPLLIGRPLSVAALEEAESGDGLALLVAQKDSSDQDPEPQDLYLTGTVIRIVQVSRLADGTARATMEGLGRAKISRYHATKGAFRASVELLTEWECEVDSEPDPILDEQALEVTRHFGEYVRLSNKVPDILFQAVAEVSDRVRLSHLVSAHMLIGSFEKQVLLEEVDVGKRLKTLLAILIREIEIFQIQKKLDEQIGFQMDLDFGGEKPDQPDRPDSPGRGQSDRSAAAADPEWVELEAAIAETPLNSEARERATRELKRLRMLNPITPEASVIRTYLDWILALPWEAETRDSLDVDRAARVLESAHFGLDEVKDRILDHIAVLSLVGRLHGPILCLVGPPGVGKTSLGKSIASCLGRKFVRLSLGGVRDEAEIRGHRRTYVGALPGRVIQGMRRSGSRNPVFLLDELDKLTRDFHGDPSAALLEVLDPDQNRTFTDHYLELEFDLSNVLFVATANALGEIPGPLRDRMEVIRLPGYMDTEKEVIARKFLWPKQVARHGLATYEPRISNTALQAIIARYTREAGVRELERRISRVARKLARQVTGTAATQLEPVEESHLPALLGPPVHVPPGREQGADRSGIACGLAWTAAGGEVLEVEVAVVPGSGQIQLTGTLGEVMKESAFAAVTYARSRARWLGLQAQFHREVDIHIHIPEGSTPKDGPSAGITIAVALISALTATPTRADLAMTGEITLRGRVLIVGGIKEKAVAALRGGIKTMLLPSANAMDIEQLPDEVRAGVKMILIDTMDQVLKEALVVAPSTDARRTPGRDPDQLRVT